MYGFLHDLEWVLPLRSPWATNLAEIFTFLGYTPFFLIFLPIGYWVWDRNRFDRLVALIMITAVVNGWLKDYWRDPRPDIRFALDGRVGDSYGRPSGHAQVATAMWFWLALELKKPWAWASAAFIVFGVIFSRLYLGVHDIDDVLTGFALGVATIIGFYILLRPGLNFWPKLRPAFQFAIIAVSILTLPLIWPQDGHSDGIVSALYLLLGWWLGGRLDRHLAPGDNRRAKGLWQGILVVGIGIPLLFVLRLVLSKAGAFVGLPHHIAADLVNIILGFYMTGLAPYLFRKTGLMR